MNEPESGSKRDHPEKHAGDSESATVFVSREGEQEKPGTKRNNEATYPEDQFAESLKRFWYFIKTTLVKASPGERLTTLTNIGVIFVGLGAICIYWGQLSANTKAANAAKSAADTAIAGTHPWVKITDLQTHGESTIIPALSFQSDPSWPTGISQVTFQLKISIKNIGHSPARLTVKFELFLPTWKDGYSDTIYEEKKKFCKAAASDGRPVDPALQRILFPEEPYDW